MLPLCPMLPFLDLHGNQIGAEGKLILRATWSGQPLNMILGEAGGGVSGSTRRILRRTREERKQLLLKDGLRSWISCSAIP